MNTAQTTETETSPTPAPAPLKYRAGYCYVTLRDVWGDFGSIARCSKAGPKKATMQHRLYVVAGPLFGSTGYTRDNLRSPCEVEITDAECEVFAAARQRLFNAMGRPMDGPERREYAAGARGLALGLFGDRLPAGAK
jgi:hypothetical protein